MGYAIVMFGVLLVMSLVVVTAYNYGIAKDSEVAPLKAENIYAERETGKVQTGLTIVDTCLSGSSTYNAASSGYGPHTLYLTVRNNGSTVLNPYNSTIFYNTSYFPFTVTSGGNVWAPLINTSIEVAGIYIYSSGGDYPPLRLMMATSNGITAIAPTSPINFSGQSVKANSSYTFSWTSSTDDTGVANYFLYAVKTKPDSCPPVNINAIRYIPGNYTSTSLDYEYACPDSSCPQMYFFIVAVDTEENMGVRSVTLNCNPPVTGKTCTKEI